MRGLFACTYRVSSSVCFIASLTIALHLNKRFPTALAFSTSSSLPSMSSSFSSIIKKDGARLATAERLMKEIYGEWEDLLDKGLFPKPLPVDEAGPSKVIYGRQEQGQTQRRYLWTDAFGVLNLVTLAMRSEQENRKARYLQAASALIESVHQTLGQPRSTQFPMSTITQEGPTGYKGLRIGKVSARRISDAGMTHDGMYWHYEDKWLFALLRYAQISGEDKTLHDVEALVQEIHPHFMAYNRDGSPRGIYWKLNSDLSVIPGLEWTGPSEDALSGWVVYSLIREEGIRRRRRKEVERQAGAEVGGNTTTISSPIEKEWREVSQVAGQYIASQGGSLRVSSDPLGYGLIGWKSQWMGQWANATRSRLQGLASIALDIPSGMQLPFRLYGAILGARLLPSSSEVRALGEQVVGTVIPYELRSPVGSPHSGINKVMLASALDPLAFARLEYEPTLPMPGGR